MKALIQRVRNAKVEVNGEVVGEIDKGLLVFVGVEKEDTEDLADKALGKLLDYRVFGDEDGKMNLSLRDIEGGLLLVSQFTLAADTRKGLRPSFSSAAPPELAEKLFAYLFKQAKDSHKNTQSGVFAADMQVSLTNDGPVTFLLELN